MLTNYFAGSYDGDAGYDIWIEFKGTDWTVELQQAFIQAADYFTGTANTAAVITADIGGGKYDGKEIDDLYLSAELTAIDGTGGILGQAGPTAVWTDNYLTSTGVMQFDTADALNYHGKGLWDDIVTHELIHTLGFGTLWEYGGRDLLDGYKYVGEHGVAAYERVMGNDQLDFIPVEDGGGSGTAGAHWDEGALRNELMTGYINSDGDSTTHTDNYLSEFSVMSLADLGYAVEYHDYPYDDALLA